MEKMTNKKALEFVLGLEVVVANEEVHAKLVKMLEQVEKKSSSAKTGKPTKAQMENEVIKSTIVEVLKGSEEPLQIKDLMEKDGLQDFSNQKLSALVRQLVSDGSVTRIEEKKVARFTV